MYNYYEAVKNDVLDYIKENIDFAEFDTLEDLEETLNHDLWVDDSITGNGSRSYTFCYATAKEYVLDNIDLVNEMIFGFDIDRETIAEKFLEENWEYFDVSIRCYVLGSCISDALKEAEEDFNAAHESK